MRVSDPKKSGINQSIEDNDEPYLLDDPLQAEPLIQVQAPAVNRVLVHP